MLTLTLIVVFLSESFFNMMRNSLLRRLFTRGEHQRIFAIFQRDEEVGQRLRCEALVELQHDVAVIAFPPPSRSPPSR
jgi:hypothetical protein